MFSITYEIITPESAENGDCEETGFEAENLTLREAFDMLRWIGGNCEPSDSSLSPYSWLSFYCEPDFVTGETKNYALHWPRNLTYSTRHRIARMFRAYGIK